MSNRSRFLINNAKEAEGLRLTRNVKAEHCIREKVKQQNLNELKQLSHRFFTENEELYKLQLDEDYEICGPLHEKQQEQEAIIAREVCKMKNKEFVLAKRRQQLVDETPELRELKASLKSLEAKKEQMNQILERQANKLRDQEIVAAQRAIEDKVWRSEEEKLKMLDCEEKMNKMKLQEGLKEQMIEKEKTKRELYADFLREKLMADDIARVLHEEDQRLWTEKMEKMQQTKEEMLEFHRAREVWRKRDEEYLKAENIRLMNFIIEKGLKEEREAKLLKEKSLHKFVAQEEVARQLMEKMGANEERDRILEELMAAELDAKVDKRHREDVEREIRQKVDTRQGLLVQMQERVDKLNYEASQDLIRRQLLIKEMGEKANIDAYAREKQRKMKVEFGIQASKIIEERKLRRAEELRAVMRDDQELIENEKSRMRLIEEERIRILKQYASLFSDNLPRGMLRASDLPHLGPDFVAAFAPVDSKK